MQVMTFAIAALTLVLFAAGATAVPPGKNVEYAGGGAGKVVFDGKVHAEKGLKWNDCHTKLFQMKKGAGMKMAHLNAGKFWRQGHNRTVALYPEAPVGTTPNGLGLSPDGRTLLVANADNNTVAIVDVEEVGRSEVEGSIPAGWYPTSAIFSPDAKRIYVLNGKGLTSSPNPRGPAPGDRGAEGQYTGSMLQGALSIIDTPTREQLAAMTTRVYGLTRYTDKARLAPPSAPVASPVPRRVGDSSPIKHVFYVIRENRTYDQVFGDIGKGNGDPTLTLFGEDVTPHAHAMANELSRHEHHQPYRHDNAHPRGPTGDSHCATAGNQDRTRRPLQLPLRVLRPGGTGEAADEGYGP